jgi:hypothetical protein
MTSKREYDAAYFTLLRAIEERDDLLRYRDQLESERQRLDAFSDATGEVDADLPRKLRRPVAGTQKQLLEAVGRRRAIVLAEQGRIEGRIAAAEAFVRECEDDVASLRG